MRPLRPIADEPIAIRQALEEGWRGFSRHAGVLMGFTALLGSLNLLSWLAYRSSGGLLERGLLPSSAKTLAEASGALICFFITGFWLVVGLLRGAERALDQQPPRIQPLLRFDAPALARLSWSLLLLLLLLGLTVRTGLTSSGLVALLVPRLALLPLIAAGVVIVYGVVDQVLLLPITVLGGQAGLSAFRSGRRATDPHWLQALGLLLAVSLILLAGFLLPLALAAALPWALCTLTAAYRQLFMLPTAAVSSDPAP